LNELITTTVISQTPKDISTLVQDIENLLITGMKDIPQELLDEFGRNVAQNIKESLSSREPRATLRMSNAGKPCERQLWYEVNSPELGDPLRPETYAKFMFGALVEHFLLLLVKLSGHTVEGTQDTQEIQGVKGHRDCVIDGVVIDAKSASSHSFKKFDNHTLTEPGNDPFAYITQIQSYLWAAQDDPVVTDKSQAGFLVMDKVLGHICLDLHEKDNKNYADVYDHKKKMVNSPELPDRGFEDVPDGVSGNRKLGTACSYCDFKKSCWPEARQFYSYQGIKFLTKVAREPRLEEVKK
jgi:hypothetical protein